MSTVLVTRSSTPSYLPHTRISRPCSASRRASACESRSPRGLVSTTQAPGQPRPRRLDGLRERLRLHHHPRAAAVGGVVADPVLAGGVLADVRHPHLEEPALLRLPEDALPEVPRAHPREQRQDLDLELGAPRHPLLRRGLLSVAPGIQQPLRRVHHDPARRAIHLDVRRERHQLLAPRAGHHQHVHPARLVQPGHRPDRLARHRHHREPLEVGPVVLPLPGVAELLAVAPAPPPRPAPPPPSGRRTPSICTAQRRPCGLASSTRPALRLALAAPERDPLERGERAVRCPPPRGGP